MAEVSIWRRVLMPWSNPVPPTVPWQGPITFRCDDCGSYHENGPCPDPVNPEQPVSER